MMDIASICNIIFLTSLFCAESAVYLAISPNRSQLFKYQPVSLSCEGGLDSGEWRTERETADGRNGTCDLDWGVSMETVCEIGVPYPWDNGLYWCESGSGERSYAVNIIVTDGNVILESPFLPVMEGAAVTLRCRYRTPPSNLTADFYKYGSLIRTESTGEMTIPAVSKSDEGLYKCNHSDLGESPESWLAVRANSSSSSSSATPSSSAPSPAPVMSLTRAICHLVVASPYLLTTIILAVKYHRRKKSRTIYARKTNSNDIFHGL